jgi:hypothetical protein
VRAVATALLWLMTVLALALGVVAGAVAVAGLLTETAARLGATSADRLARRYHLAPFTSGLRDELRAVITGMGDHTS